MSQEQETKQYYVVLDDNGGIAMCADWNFPGSTAVDYECVLGYDGRWYEKGKEPQKPLEQVQAEIQSQFVNMIQERLDRFAQSRGYDNIMSVCTYSNSTTPRFKAEADRAIYLRDTTWSKCYEILEQVLAGERSIPTEEELLTELPELTWEDSANS